jgi:drug/metabolite transporter (DMT)-like permease
MRVTILYIKMIAATILWGISYSLAKMQIEESSLATSLSIRYIFFFLFLFSFYMISGKWREDLKKINGQQVAIIITAGIFFSFYAMMDISSVSMMPAGFNAVFVDVTISLVTIGVAVLYFKEKWVRSQSFAFGVCIIALTAMSYHEMVSDVTPVKLIGLVLASLTALGYVGYLYISKLKMIEISPIGVLTASYAIAALILPLLIVSTGTKLSFSHLSSKFWLLTLLLPLLSGCLASLWWQEAITKVKLSVIASVSLLIPVFALIASYFIMNEAMSSLKVGCAIVIFSTVVWIEYKNKKT